MVGRRSEGFEHPYELDSQGPHGWIIELFDDQSQAIFALLLDEPRQDLSPPVTESPICGNLGHTLIVLGTSDIEQSVCDAVQIDFAHRRIELELIE